MDESDAEIQEDLENMDIRENQDDDVDGKVYDLILILDPRDNSIFELMFLDGGESVEEVNEERIGQDLDEGATEEELQDTPV